MAQEIIVADIGGTHARFAIASIADGKVSGLSNAIKMQCSEYVSLQEVWEAYGDQLGRPLPCNGAIAVAAPVGGDVIHLTNSNWVIRPALIQEKLALDRITWVNDFGAIGHAIAQLGPEMFAPVCGPDEPVTENGIITVVGPGTGLGVTHILRNGRDYHVTETEGGHIDFAPLDQVEDLIVEHLRQLHGCVSAERVVSGPGLSAIHKTLATMENQDAPDMDDKTLWDLAVSGTDRLASESFDRFCLCLGAVTGDLALAQGAKSVVITGGLGQRIADRLPSSGFCERFVAKGRFQSMMEEIPVKQLLHEEPGLYGAAAAFLKEHQPQVTN